ncbi:MAG: T9SS type A sorting domain-containing protein [Phaeodactylibacter sp.]|uniref:T9SS type A sorting domain-containing protein n=1 Tax=Phaeodactylibacter sp. TaxID=1940289 RepID=UPI0032F03A57
MKSYLIAHEMGHCLGLLHTHNSDNGQPITGPEYVDQDNDPGNCLDNGDCVCDTPADPNIDTKVTYNNDECTYIGPYEMDDFDDYYDPHLDNIMSYTNYQCYHRFTDGQGKRMRNFIATSTILGDCLVDPNTVIQANTTWDLNSIPDGTVNILGTLEIEDGAILTIKPGITVSFAEQGKLIINPNAKLILEGTLTSGCQESCSSSSFCSDTWQGVEVWGDQSTHQFSISGYRAQGSFIGKPGAIVENAKVGVQLWGPTPVQAGGVISCSETTFRNNIIGIDFRPYDNFYPENYPPTIAGDPTRYFASFSNCDFVSNSSYPHQESFDKFVRMAGVKGPRFLGCSFVNTYVPQNTSSPADFGYGIYAFESGFRVEPKCNSTTYPCTSYNRSEFRGLGYGVYAAAITGQSDVPYIVRQSDFYDCFIGINNRLVSSSTMLLNNFYLGTPPSSMIDSDQIGIALNGYFTGLALEENAFIGSTTPSPNRTIGVSSFNIGLDNKVIRRNTFSGLSIGNQAGGICGSEVSGLLYECNINISSTEYDFLVCAAEPFAINTIKQEQVIFDINDENMTIATGNTFSNTGSATDRDFANYGIPLSAYSAAAGQAETPDEYSGIESLIPAEANTCPESYCAPPCKTTSEIALLKQSFYEERSEYDLAMEAYTLLSGSNDSTLLRQKLLAASRHKLQMDKSAQMVLLHSLYDTLHYSKDTVRTWMYNIGTFGAQLAIAFDYLGVGDTTSGWSVLNSIPGNTPLTAQQVSDLEGAKFVFELLSDQSLYTLPEEILVKLEEVAQTGEAFSRTLAGNILSWYGEDIGPENCWHERQTEEVEGRSFEFEPDTRSQLVVFPNPGRERIYFERPPASTATAATIRITDAMGRAVWQYTMPAGESQVSWDASRHPTGFYFYQVAAKDGATWNGKLIVE